MLRIANIIEEGKVGGPQVRMIRVAAALTGRAETVIIMPRQNAATFQSLCRDAGIEYVALPLSRITREWRIALRYVLFFPYEIWRIYRILKKGQFDLVHVSGGSWQYKGVIAAKLAGIPAIWHLNDTQMPGFIRRVFDMLSPLATGFIFASHRSRAYYGTRLPDRLQEVIPSTVDAARFDPERQHPGDEGLLGKLGNAPVIGTVANINPIKGIETLIRAAAILRDTNPDLRVLVIGSIPARQRTYHAQLLNLARDLGVSNNIEWTGRRGDVRPLLASLNVYVCTSLAESSPVSVWEAMAMARPVVSTDVGDVARHVIDDKCGHIVPVGDHKAIAERVQRLFDDKARAQHLGAKARASITNDLAPTRIAHKTLAFYECVLAFHNRRNEPKR